MEVGEAERVKRRQRCSTYWSVGIAGVSYMAKLDSTVQYRQGMRRIERKQALVSERLVIETQTGR